MENTINHTIRVSKPNTLTGNTTSGYTNKWLDTSIRFYNVEYGDVH